MSETVGEVHSQEFRRSIVITPEGDILSQFNQGDVEFGRHILIFSEISSSGGLNLHMDAFPLDAALLPSLAEKYLLEMGKKPIRRFKKDGHNIIKSSDGEVQFNLTQQKGKQTTDIKISLSQMGDNVNESLVDLISTVKQLPKEKIKSFLDEIVAARKEQSGSTSA